MKQMGEYLVDMLKELEARKNRPLTIVECGTIRNPSFDGHEDGLSTYFMAKWSKESNRPHRIYSFELEHGTMMAAKHFLQTNELDKYVTFCLGDAAKMLQHFQDAVDFVYLDAGADPFENFAQFRYAVYWMDAPGLVVIDDVYDKRNANRGLITVPWAQLEGMPTAKIANRMAGIAIGNPGNPVCLPDVGSAWRIPVEPGLRDI